MHCAGELHTHNESPRERWGYQSRQDGSGQGKDVEDVACLGANLTKLRQALRTRAISGLGRARSQGARLVLAQLSESNFGKQSDQTSNIQRHVKLALRLHIPSYWG